MVSTPQDAARAAALNEVFLPDLPLTDLLDRVAQLATRTIPHCTLAGLTLPQNGKAATPVFTDARSPLVDQAQYDADSGPCLDAFRDGHVNAIEDIATETRWPAFCAAAAAEGIGSTLSVPLKVGAADEPAMGALNLYSDRSHGFDDEAAAAAESFAHQAAIVLANAVAYWGARELSENLQTALESRATIEQAKGVLMAESGVSPDEAFQMLVRASQRSNRKLREIAVDIVERASGRGRPAAGGT